MYPLLGHVPPCCLHQVVGTSRVTHGTLTADQQWPDIMIVTAGVKHCFLVDDHRGVNTANTWRSSLPKASVNRNIILTDIRQLPNPEADRSSQERHCIGRHPSVINEQLSSGTGMYLLQSTFEAIEKETKLDPQLVVVEKSIEHGLLHLNGMNI